MQTKRAVPVILLMLYCTIAALLCGCGALSGSTAAAPADPPVTPYDTSAGTLDVRVTIMEDQDALSNRSTIAISFSTDFIEDQNYVLFDDPQEKVNCNGVTMTLGHSSAYTLSVPHGEYVCQYRGTRQDEDNNQIAVLPYAQMFDVHPASMLSPELPTVNGSGFTLHYVPDGPNSHCNIVATAIDRIQGDPQIVGAPSPSTIGTYSGPSTAALKGPGDIELTRTCDVSSSSSGLFDSMHVTYITKASVEVTWTT